MILGVQQLSDTQPKIPIQCRYVSRFNIRAGEEDLYKSEKKFNYSRQNSLAKFSITKESFINQFKLKR